MPDLGALFPKLPTVSMEAVAAAREGFDVFLWQEYGIAKVIHDGCMESALQYALPILLKDNSEAKGETP